MKDNAEEEKLSSCVSFALAKSCCQDNAEGKKRIPQEVYPYQTMLLVKVNAGERSELYLWKLLGVERSVWDAWVDGSPSQRNAAVSS